MLLRTVMHASALLCLTTQGAEAQATWFYRGIHFPEARYLLNKDRIGEWSLPSCSTCSDFVQPRVPMSTSSQGVVDAHVAAAVMYAWAAEVHSKMGKADLAADEARQMHDELVLFAKYCTARAAQSTRGIWACPAPATDADAPEPGDPEMSRRPNTNASSGATAGNSATRAGELGSSAATAADAARARDPRTMTSAEIQAELESISSWISNDLARAARTRTRLDQNSGSTIGADITNAALQGCNLTASWSKNIYDARGRSNPKSADAEGASFRVPLDAFKDGLVMIVPAAPGIFADPHFELLARTLPERAVGAETKVLGGKSAPPAPTSEFRLPAGNNERVAEEIRVTLKRAIALCSN